MPLPISWGYLTYSYFFKSNTQHVKTQESNVEKSGDSNIFGLKKIKDTSTWSVRKESFWGNVRCISFLEHLKLGQKTHRTSQWEYWVVPLDMAKGIDSSHSSPQDCQIRQSNPLTNSFLSKIQQGFAPANSKNRCRTHRVLKAKTTFFEPK